MSQPGFSEQPAQAAEARHAIHTLVSDSRRMMGTEVSVHISAPAERAGEAAAAVRASLDWLGEVDAHLSRFQPDSELSRLNAAGGAEFPASALLLDAVETALQAAAASDGLFDPALLPRLAALGYDRDFALLAREASAESDTPIPARGSGGTGGQWRDIRLDVARGLIQLPPGAALDLGGIAKGWAADRALDRYCAAFPGAIVNVGGDLRLRGGPQPGASWTVGLRDPRAEERRASGQAQQEEYIAHLTFSRGGLATSGSVRRWWWRDGQRQHHLLDPRTGQPVSLWLGAAGATNESEPHEPQVATVTALAPTAARAEAATKVALLRQFPAALRHVEDAWKRWGAVGPAETDADIGVALIFILSDGTMVPSSNLDAWLASWGTVGAPLPTVLGASR